MQTLNSHQLSFSFELPHEGLSLETSKFLNKSNEIYDNLSDLKRFDAIFKIHRGYYTAPRRYDFYLRMVKTIFYEQAQRVSKILFLTREDESHIFKPPCNVLFII